MKKELIPNSGGTGKTKSDRRMPERTNRQKDKVKFIVTETDGNTDNESKKQ